MIFKCIWFLLVLVGAVQSTNGLSVNKCCDVNQELNARRECVNAKWNPYDPVRKHIPVLLVHPIDSRWLRRWLPPSIPLNRIEEVWVDARRSIRVKLDYFSFNISKSWDTKELENKISWMNKVIFNGAGIIIRGRYGNTIRTVDYCIDARQNSNFELLVSSECRKSIYDFIKCCKPGESLKILAKELSCQHQKVLPSYEIEGVVHLKEPLTCSRFGPSISLGWTFGKYQQIKTDFCIFPERDAPQWRRRDLCADSIVEGSETRHVLVYCEWTRVAKGVFYYCRYLPFASLAVLVGALATIACSARLRTSVHGWALAMHTACLLMFNAGQALFVLTTRPDMDHYFLIPEREKESCLSFAFALYFFLLAAASWLTAVSINLTTGFRVTRGRPGRERRKFLWLCAGAWVLPVVFTAVAVTTFYVKTKQEYVIYADNPHFQRYLMVSYTGPWYLPSFVETRSCFSDLAFSGRSFVTKKLGSLLFYFGPLSALLVVNVVCLGRAARRVHFLRRGNSLLQRDREESCSAHTAGGALTQAQSIMVYIKMLLSTGLLETIAEIAVWACNHSTGNGQDNMFAAADHMYTYRTVGSFCDFLRALCVLWLAAPGASEQVTALWRRLVERARGRNKK